MALKAFQSCIRLFNPGSSSFSFELFGLDFMIDDDFKPWLIEVNYNPSITTKGDVTGSLIPLLIENVFK